MTSPIGQIQRMAAELMEAQACANDINHPAIRMPTTAFEPCRKNRDENASPPDCVCALATHPSFMCRS